MEYEKGNRFQYVDLSSVSLHQVNRVINLLSETISVPIEPAEVVFYFPGGES